MSPQFPNLTVVEHPLIQHKLAVLRDRNTSKKIFREVVGEMKPVEFVRDTAAISRAQQDQILSTNAARLLGLMN